MIAHPKCYGAKVKWSTVCSPKQEGGDWVSELLKFEIDYLAQMCIGCVSKSSYSFDKVDSHLCDKRSMCLEYECVSGFLLDCKKIFILRHLGSL